MRHEAEAAECRQCHYADDKADNHWQSTEISKYIQLDACPHTYKHKHTRTNKRTHAQKQAHAHEHAHAHAHTHI